MQKKIKQNKKTERNNGITLIALVITIIVLLILAAVSIATLTGENGILSRANEAKTSTEITEEKEKVELSALGAIAKDNGGEIKRNYLDEELKSYIGENNYTLTETAPFKVTITANNRSYIIDARGNVSEEKVITLDQAKQDNMLNETGNSKVEVGDGTFTLPGGFKVAEDSGSTVEEGIVIIDENNNEFVWVPTEVSEIANEISGTDENENQNYQGKLYDFPTATTSQEKTDYGQGTKSYREPDVVTNYDNNTEYLNIIKSILTGEENASKYADMTAFGKTMQEDYNKMVKSISENHGFYVSRYEMSKSSNGKAASVGNVTPIVNDENNRWYGIYAYGKTYTNRTNSVESSMIWGSQYDAMMRWMQTGEHKVDVTGNIGDNRNQKTITKPSNTDVIKKVYDLYGCHYEWTLEANDAHFRVYRGRWLRLQSFT